MANDKNKPYGSGKADTKDEQRSTASDSSRQNTGNDRDQSRSQGMGQSTSRTPDAGRSNTGDRDRNSSLEGAGSRDGATGGNPDGMRKDSTNDARAERASGDVQRDNDSDRSGANQREVPQG